MQLKDVDRLLESGPLPIETGYCRLPGKRMFVAISTCMPGCKARWVEWAIGDKKNIDLNKKSTGKLHTNKLIAQFNMDEEHPGKYLMQPLVDKTDFKHMDPSRYFDSEKLKNFKLGKIACYKMLSGRRVQGYHIIVIKNTEYGCELKLYFWLNNYNEEKAKILLDHCKDDAGRLSEYLPVFVKKIKHGSHGDDDDIACKYCYSDEIVKNGHRKGGQYWLCKNCGHCFINNGALPNMKYSFDVIARAVREYVAGRSLKNIRQSVEKEYGHVPSTATLYRWVARLTQMLNDTPAR